MPTFNPGVGDSVIWDSRIGPVTAEFRGKQWGVDGAQACIIVREEGSCPYQTMVAYCELKPVKGVVYVPSQASRSAEAGEAQGR